MVSRPPGIVPTADPYPVIERTPLVVLVFLPPSFMPSSRVVGERAAELARAHGRGADLPDRDAGRLIGEPRRFLEAAARRERERARREHGVAGAGHVVDLLRGGREVS